MTSAKWKLLTAPPLTSTTIRFWSAPPSAVQQWMSIIEFRRTPPPEKQYFDISMYLYIAFFFAKAHNVYKFYKNNKTDRKANTR